MNFSHPFLTYHNLNPIDPDLPYTLTKIIAPCCLFPAPPPNISISPTGKMVCKVSALDHNICSRLDVSDTNFLRKWEIFHNLSRYQKNFKAPSTIDYCKKEEILIISYNPCFLRNNRINATKKWGVKDKMKIKSSEWDKLKACAFLQGSSLGARFPAPHHYTFPALPWIYHLMEHMPAIGGDTGCNNS